MNKIAKHDKPEEPSDVAAAYALGTLDASKAAEFEHHLAECAACSAEVARHGETLARFVLNDGLKNPPTSSRERFLERLRPENNGQSAMRTAATSITRSNERAILGMGLLHDQVRHNDHIAYFWETENEFAQAVGFLETGLRSRDHCVAFGYDEANLKVLKILRQHGCDPDRLKQEGRLTILGPKSTGDETLQHIGDTFAHAVQSGSLLIRLLGNIGWGRSGWPSKEEMLAFESKVTKAAKQFPCIVVCMYDVANLPGDVVLKGAFETHPLIIRRNLIRDNAQWVPVDKFLAAGSQRIHPF